MGLERHNSTLGSKISSNTIYNDCVPYLWTLPTLGSIGFMTPTTLQCIHPIWKNSLYIHNVKNFFSYSVFYQNPLEYSITITCPSKHILVVFYKIIGPLRTLRALTQNPTSSSMIDYDEPFHLM